jgi:hypothetical protein
LTAHGLELPAALQGKDFGTNLARNKRYDQILHYPVYSQNFTNHGGVLDFYSGGTGSLFPDMDKTRFTYQLSDPLPLWMQINTNIAGLQLDEIIQAGRGG